MSLLCVFLSVCVVHVCYCVNVCVCVCVCCEEPSDGSAAEAITLQVKLLKKRKRDGSGRRGSEEVLKRSF